MAKNNRNKNRSKRSNRRVSAQTRFRISKGVEESWKKRGLKYGAAGLTTLAVGAVAYKNRDSLIKKAGQFKEAATEATYSTIKKAGKPFRDLDEFIAPSVESFVRTSLKKPESKANLVDRLAQSFFPQKSMEAALIGKAKATVDIKVDSIKDQVEKALPAVQKQVQDTIPKVKQTVEVATKTVKEHPKAVIDTPKKTIDAFKEGYDTAKPGDPSYEAGRAVAKKIATQKARVRVRAQQDIEKLRRWKGLLGFQEDTSNLIEFAKRKRRKKSPAERAAISQGLREYYAGQPRSSNLDKADRVSLTVARAAGAGSALLSTAGLGLGIAGQLKALTYKPSRGERIFQNVSAGAGLLSSLSGSYRGFGTGTRSLAGSANIYDDLRIGAKRTRFGHTDRRLNLEQDKFGLSKDRAKSYRTIANSSARANSPGGAKFEDMVTRRAKYENVSANQVKLNLRKKPKG